MTVVDRVATTPIKGFRMHEPQAVLLTETGIAGDRAFFLIDAADRLVSATGTDRFLRYWARYDHELEVLSIGRGDETNLEDRVVTGPQVRAHFFGERYVIGQVVEGAWARTLSDIAGQPLRLVRATGPLGGYDVHHVSIVGGSSVRALTEGTDAPVLDSRRFRMTVTLEGAAPFAEDGWVGRTLAVGDALIRVAAPVRRCAAVQKDPEGLGGRADALRLIKEVRGSTTSAHGRGLHLGVYGEVIRGGLISCGDDVRPVS